jgi:hypothetical protein
MAESGSYKEKRNLRRLSALVQLTYFNFTSNKVGKAKIEDMSAKGVGFVAEEALEPNMPLDIWIDIPEAGEHVHAEGEVIWVKKLDKNQYRIGVNLKYSGLTPLPQVLKKMTQSNPPHSV